MRCARYKELNNNKEIKINESFVQIVMFLEREFREEVGSCVAKSE